MNDIFITGTFRNEWNKNFNMLLCTGLESQGLKVFLPQRDSEQLGDDKNTFLQDVEGINNCKAIVAVGSKTQTANWGFEIGYAYSKGMPIFIITDKDHPVELMPKGAVSEIIIVDNLDDTLIYINKLVNSIKQKINGK